MNLLKSIVAASLLLLVCGWAVNGYSQASLTSGLVAYYPFNGNANDASGNGNNGTIYGGVTLTADRFGNANSAYSFDGSTGYIDIPQNNVLNAMVTNFTISAWIWQNGAKTAGYRILDKCPEGTPDGWSFDTGGHSDGTSSGQELRFQAAASNGNNVSGSNYYSLEVWHHVVATVSGTNGTLYLDGTNYGIGVVGNIPINTLDVYVAQAHNGSGPGGGIWFKGYIDDIRIYNRTLSATEVQELYNYESSPQVALIKAVMPSFFNLTLTTNYQLQASTDLVNWTNQGSPFTATNSSMIYPQYYNVADWNSLFFRLRVSP